MISYDEPEDIKGQNGSHRNDEQQPRAYSQKSSSVKKQRPKQQKGGHYFQRSFDPQSAQSTGQPMVDEYSYSYPQNYDGQSTTLQSQVSPGMAPSLMPHVQQMGQPAGMVQQYSDSFPGGGYPVAMDQDGHYYPSGFEMMPGSGQPVHPSLLSEHEINAQLIDPYNFYQYGDFGGSIATYTETGGPSMDEDGGQYYEPIMMTPGMHPGHLNYPPMADAGGGYSGEDSFPGSQHQFPAQYRNFGYGPYQSQNYGGYEGMTHLGEGLEGYDADMNRNEELMRLSTEQLLQTSIPDLPRRDAAALIIEEQDRGFHGTGFASHQDAKRYQGLNRNRLSSSQGFQPTREHSPRSAMTPAGVTGRVGGQRHREKRPTSKNSSMTKGNVSRRSGTMQNNFLASDEDVKATQVRDDVQDRQTFGSQGSARRQSPGRQLSRRSLEESMRDGGGQGQAASVYGPVGDHSKKPPKPNLALDQSQTSLPDATKTSRQLSGKMTPRRQARAKEYRVHDDSPGRQRMQLELARQNSQKSRRSQQIQDGVVAPAEQVVESPEGSAGRQDQPQQSIELNGSRLQEYQQQDGVKTTRSAADHAAPPTPKQSAGGSQASQRQSHPVPAEAQEAEVADGQGGAGAPELTQDAVVCPIVNPFAEDQLAISPNEQPLPPEQVLGDSPVPLAKVGNDEPLDAQQSLKVAETVGQGVIAVDEEVIESQPVQGSGDEHQIGSIELTEPINEPLRERVEGAQLAPGSALAEQAPKEELEEAAQAEGDAVEAAGNQSVVEQVAAFPNIRVEEFTDEQANESFLAGTAMIKQPSSGETASQFHGVESPRVVKPPRPPQNFSHHILGPELQLDPGQGQPLVQPMSARSKDRLASQRSILSGQIGVETVDQPDDKDKLEAVQDMGVNQNENVQEVAQIEKLSPNTADQFVDQNDCVFEEAVGPSMPEEIAQDQAEKAADDEPVANIEGQTELPVAGLVEEPVEASGPLDQVPPEHFEDPNTMLDIQATVDQPARSHLEDGDPLTQNIVDDQLQTVDVQDPLTAENLEPQVNEPIVRGDRTVAADDLPLEQAPESNLVFDAAANDLAEQQDVNLEPKPVAEEIIMEPQVIPGDLNAIETVENLNINENIEQQLDTQQIGDGAIQEEDALLAEQEREHLLLKQEVMESLKRDEERQHDGDAMLFIEVEQALAQEEVAAIGEPEQAPASSLEELPGPLPIDATSSMPLLEQAVDELLAERTADIVQQTDAAAYVSADPLVENWKNDQPQQPLDIQGQTKFEDQFGFQNSSEHAEKQPTEIDLIFESFINMEKIQFLDAELAPDGAEDGGEGLLGAFFEDMVKRDRDQDLQSRRAELHDVEYRKLQEEAAPRSHAQLGHAWRDGLEAKHRKYRARLPDIDECSSVESLPVHPREAVEPYDLQYILYDFDFASKSAFKMQPLINGEEREHIQQRRAEIEEIERRHLMHLAGQDRQKRAAETQPQSALLELARDEEGAPRKRAQVVVPLDGADEAGTPKAAATTPMNVQELPRRRLDRSPPGPHGERLARLPGYEARRQDKRLKQRQASFSTFSARAQGLAAQERAAARAQKGAAKQSLSEQKAVLKSKIKDFKASLQRQGPLQFHSGRKLTEHRRRGSAANAGQATRPGGDLFASSVKQRTYSKSPRPAATLGQIEKAKTKRYASPQLARPFSKTGRAGAKKQAKKDVKGAGPARRSLTRREKGRLESDSPQYEVAEAAQEDEGMQDGSAQLTDQQRQDARKATIRVRGFEADAMIEEGDEEDDESFAGQAFDEMTVENEDYDEEHDDAKASNLFGSGSEQLQQDAKDFEDNSDYQQFMYDLKISGPQASAQNKDASLLLTNELITDRLNEEQSECLVQSLEFFIVDLRHFLRREQEFTQKKEFKTVKPEQVRINQKIVYRMDYDAIFHKIENEEHELIRYLCKSRRHFIHLKKEHQDRLDKILFEQNCFVYLLKHSKNMRTELNSASETASHAVSARAKIKNLGQLQKRISQESLSKAAKKPVLFKNKVDKFLHDYSIQQQDVLDIERLLPVLQSMASAPSSTPQSQPFMSSTAKLEKTAGSNYAAKLTSMEPRRSAHTGQLSATATMMSKQLPTIEEDGVEAPKFEVNDDGEEASVYLSSSGLRLSKLETINLTKLKDQLTPDELYDIGLLQISKVFTQKSIIDTEENKKIFLQDKYIAVFHYFSCYTSSALFENLQQNCIYYKIDQILRRVPPQYFEHIKKNNLDRCAVHTERVQGQSTTRTDNKLSVFDAGFPNLQYQFSQDYTLDVYIRRLMYQSRPIMEQIKHMIFQSKQCLLIQNLIPEYFENRQEKKASTLCLAAGCRTDPREDFILTKFNELYYLSCEKDDTYKFNIRQTLGKDGEQNGAKKGTFYDDQPQEQSSDDSDDLTSYMVNTYVNQAVQQDPKDLSRFQEKILQEYMAYKNLRKQRASSAAGGQDGRRGKKLRDKLRINSSLQMVQFCHAGNADEDEDTLARNGKAANEREGSPSALAGLPAGSKPKREEHRDGGKDEEAHGSLNAPRRAAQRPQENTKEEKKETYPKFKLSLAFGYGQFISSDNLFEVFDTKLVSQAEKDDATRERKKQRREQDIQEKREQHQQAIQNLLKEKLRSSSSLAENMKYKPTKMDRERYNYRPVKQGLGGSSIYIVTPLHLLAAVEDTTGTMEKFVRDIAIPKQFHPKPKALPADQEEVLQIPGLDPCPLEGVQALSDQPEQIEDGNKEQVQNDQNKGRNNIEGDPINQNNTNDRFSKYQTQDNKLTMSAMARLGMYRQRFQNVYESSPNLLDVDLYEVKYDDISEKDSILEINSEEGDLGFDTERTRRSPGTPEKSLSFNFLNIKGRGRTQSTTQPRPFKARAGLPSPLKQSENPRFKPRKSIQTNLQFLFRPSATLWAGKDGSGLPRRQSLLEHKPSLSDTNDFSQTPADTNLDAKSKNELLEDTIVKNISADFFEVESECDIDSRPEMCRVTLQHIKHVHLSRLQRRIELVESVGRLIASIHVEHELDQKMNDDLKLLISNIKEKRLLVQKRKEKVIQDCQIQESNSQMQLLANLNTNTAFKPIEYQQCMRVYAEPIQIIKIVDNKPQMYRQKDIFTPIVSRLIQTQEKYVFSYDFQDMNEPKFKPIRKSTNAEKRRSSLNQSALQYETFIYQDEMSPAFVESEDAPDLANKKQPDDAACLDKFDHLSSDRQSDGSVLGSDDDLGLPVLLRLENARMKKKQPHTVPGLKLNRANEYQQLAKSTKQIKSVRFGSETNLQIFPNQASERSDKQAASAADIAAGAKAAGIDPNVAAGDSAAQDAQETRKKENMASLQKGLKRQQMNVEQKLRRRQALKAILTNKPINHINSDAGKKLQEDIERMNKETDLASSLLPAGLGLGGPPQPQNFPLKSLVHTVGKVMECSDKTQMFNEEDGMSEGASQKLRKAIEVNQPQVIQDFVLYNGRAIDLYDKDGFTLLCRAVHYGRSDIVELLLKAGADPSKPCRDSEDSPLHIAVNFNFKKVQDLLLDHNANETKLNKKGLLPWQGIVHQNQSSSRYQAPNPL